MKKKKKGAFVAGNHLCWFSRNESYKQKTVNEVLAENPSYLLWCLQNLKYLRFAMGLTRRIKEKNKNHE